MYTLSGFSTTLETYCLVPCTASSFREGVSSRWKEFDLQETFFFFFQSRTLLISEVKTSLLELSSLQVYPFSLSATILYLQIRMRNKDNSSIIFTFLPNFTTLKPERTAFVNSVTQIRLLLKAV